jgi:predicted MFS family arabinose efflux permease
VPITVAVGGWFNAKRATALGVTTTGIGLGTLVVVPIAEWMIRTQGWRDAFRVLGVASVVVYVLVALAIARPPVSPAPQGSLGDRSHLASVMRRPAYWRLYGSGLLMSIALFAPFVYLVTYATDRGISESSAALLISILGVGSVVGRLGIGPIAARFGVLPLVVTAFAVQPVAYLVWLAADASYPLMAAFAALLGVGYGGYVALSPVAAAELFGLQGLGRVLGVLYTSAGLGALVGPYALGIVIERAGFGTMILLSVGLSGLATSVAIPLWFEGRDRSAQDARRTPLTSAGPLVFGLVPVVIDPPVEREPDPPRVRQIEESSAMAGGS